MPLLPTAVVDLENLSREELDRLPFGVIQVDNIGTILNYNAAESRLSGFTPHQVLGRNFFTEVAPCAGMPSFYVRFLNGMQRDSFRLRLSYTFTFQAAPVRVYIVAMRASGQRTAWIQIHRVSDLPDPIDHDIREFIEARNLGLRSAADREAEENCAREPIRTPTAIQPHGGVLVLDSEGRTVTAWSENIGEYLEAPLHSGASLERVFSELAELLEVPVLEEVEDGAPLFIDHVRRGAETFDVRVQRSGVHLLVELEHALAEPPGGQLLLHVHRGRAALEKVTSIEALASKAAEIAGAISGLDRIIVYRFDKDASGVALGEHLANDSFPPLLGLHFPESDIPAQARALYLESPLRHTPNNDYHAVPLVGAADGAPPIDLGLCELRSTSPFHRAYHRNMRVAASFSASIKVDGQLWGLLLGHHTRPRHLRSALRYALSELARSLAYNILRLKAIEAEEPAEHRRLRHAIAQRALGDDLTSLGDLLEGSPSLADLFDASGVVVLEGEQVRGRGTIPSREVSLRLREHLGSLDTPIYMTQSLAVDLPELADQVHSVAGVLGVNFGSGSDVCVLWIRGEEPEEVVWGGAPSKDSIEVEGRRFLLPRRSFERWVETRRGLAAPWPDWTRASALDLRQVILTALAHHARAALQRNLLQWQLTQARTTYLSTMSHELRTPLSAILGIIETTDAEALPEGVRADLKLVKEAAGDLNQIIDDVLDYARLEVGDSRDQFHAVASDLDQTLRRAVDLLRPRAKERGLELRFEVGEAMLPIELDSRRITQVVGQLVHNAIKYTDEGEICVVRQLVAAERVRIEVIDTGVGLPDADVESLFEAFSRANLRKHTQHRPGSGLGLAVSRAIVVALGGEIGAHSNPGGGSTFWIELPVRFIEAAPGDATPPKPPPLADRAEHLDLLLAEDNDVNRMIMARMLAVQGWSVTEVASGGAAVQAASKRAFDVMLFDLHMPDGDGPDALSEIRRGRGPSASAPALLITADVDASALNDRALEHFSAVLVKPVDIDRLRDAVLGAIQPA